MKPETRDEFDDLLERFGKGVDRAGRGLGRLLIRTGNVLTGRELTQDEDQAAFKQMQRRDAFFAEAKDRGEPYHVTFMRWRVAEHDRRKSLAGQPPADK
ncbi:MAG: hypothetical protein UT86_C0001G0276 [Candidatus Magasanikbacteria bacterium GW2011_GWC2_40_17]|uniref:Uncharacterized protein n=1 Tax=Candidatus Magasanikbacteria bacterium GW2011_GWA2_42_32 TaxID=1619039 RepID=A0A0G1CGF2_9BACT|nr:MAG: hypothetical protein UT86_C0001G0276 [Candidatus Magasanikbacteria bacterium GW2011_GWC2_40_17]KKS57636.1 MAG: hypothetical protein UV20_C0001G0276 [Candidatus Magasanikbacteria bacterium GW2011_GWA2_42_32]OGH85904.1 MAG: hypothetical protein A2294_00230 [Candidatus Magasanikbacteria bacterium RIFOXYB2_FULL_38_10]